ncbi:N-acetylmuramidase domain-containing protein [uncultured Nitratireductor sp.]|uniref:N-acetylmuramidase domain-containing protein n=1 Tax=uncultured Nitratireductor sp. TaxID=520953 RepID=UPI0025FBCDE5|nr:N-acetylmuramidase domain-containing protein [uncultured Nitratireductor sp.]
MFSKKAITEISEAALRAKLEPALLLAVAQVESGGRTHAVVRGRVEPLIRFGGHYFDGRLSNAKRAQARAAGLASPKVGGVANPRSQRERWALLEQATRIDRKAALESVSWGIGQVMGAHWNRLGFTDVEALVTEARDGATGQARLMLRYIEKAGLREALASRDWARFAHGYNGPAYRRNQYDRKLAQAYRAYAVDQAPVAEKLLRVGSRGCAVESLQTMLLALGYPVTSDGIFGKRTEKTVKRFQSDAGLVQDGLVGRATRKALRQALPFNGLRSRLRAAVSRLWQRLQWLF